MAGNGLTDSIRVLHSHSTAVELGKHLPHRADLLVCIPTLLLPDWCLQVTELVDSGLLGEHIIPALAHAKRELLTEDAVVSRTSRCLAASIFLLLSRCLSLFLSLSHRVSLSRCLSLLFLLSCCLSLSLESVPPCSNSLS